MKVVIEILDPQGNKTQYEFGVGRFLIGKSEKCDITLKDGHASRSHATLEISGHDVILSDNNSTNGTWFEGQRILNPILLQQGDVLRLGTMNLVVARIELDAASTPGAALRMNEKKDALDDIYGQDAGYLAESFQPEPPEPQQVEPEPAPVRPAARARLLEPALEKVEPALEKEMPALSVQESEPNEFTDKKNASGIPGGIPNGGIPNEAANARAEEIIKMMDESAWMGEQNLNNAEKQAFKRKVMACAQQLVQKELARIDEQVRSRTRQQEVNLDLVSYGELQPLMEDDAVTEIMINGYEGIYIERDGCIQKLDYEFSDEDGLERLLFRMVSPLGIHIKMQEPIIDTRLPDGSRLNIVLPPVSTIGPSVTIRKRCVQFPAEEDLINVGSCDLEMLSFLKHCVVQKRNIIVAGRVGSGKTSVLNLLANFVDQDERVIVIEETGELVIQLPHVISLQTGLAKLQRVSSLDMKDLIKNALSMRPDRIVIGECKGEDVFDTLMMTGTSASGLLMTFHAYTPHDLLTQLEMQMLIAKPDLPVRLIREQIVRSLDIVVHVERYADGSRKIANIMEVIGIEEDCVAMQPVYRFLKSGVSTQGAVWGRFEATGYVPEFYRALEDNGEGADKSTFDR